MPKIYLIVTLVFFTPFAWAESCISSDKESDFASKLDFLSFLINSKSEPRATCISHEISQRFLKVDKRYWNGQLDTEFRAELLDEFSFDIGRLNLAKSNRVIRATSTKQIQSLTPIDTVKDYHSTGVLSD